MHLLLSVTWNDSVRLIGSRGPFRGDLSVAARKNWRRPQRISVMGLFKYLSVSLTSDLGYPAHGQPSCYFNTETYKWLLIAINICSVKVTSKKNVVDSDARNFTVTNQLRQENNLQSVFHLVSIRSGYSSRHTLSAKPAGNCNHIHIPFECYDSNPTCNVFYTSRGLKKFPSVLRYVIPIDQLQLTSLEPNCAPSAHPGKVACVREFYWSIVIPRWKEGSRV